jgi:hypothetical protein
MAHIIIYGMMFSGIYGLGYGTYEKLKNTPCREKKYLIPYSFIFGGIPGIIVYGLGTPLLHITDFMINTENNIHRKMNTKNVEYKNNE